MGWRAENMEWLKFLFKEYLTPFASFLGAGNEVITGKVTYKNIGRWRDIPSLHPPITTLKQNALPWFVHVTLRKSKRMVEADCSIILIGWVFKKSLNSFESSSLRRQWWCLDLRSQNLSYLKCCFPSIHASQRRQRATTRKPFIIYWIWWLMVCFVSWTNFSPNTKIVLHTRQTSNGKSQLFHTHTHAQS